MFCITDNVENLYSQKNASRYEITNNHQDYRQLKTYYQLLPNHIELKALNSSNHQQCLKATCQNQTKIPGKGQVMIFYPYPISSKNELANRATVIQRQLDCLRELYVINCNNTSLHIGDSVLVNNSL